MNNILRANLLIITLLALNISSLFAAERSYKLSVADLIRNKELPEVDAQGTLNLSKKNLTSLEGLNLIKNKEKIININLTNNKIHSLNNKDFAGFLQVTHIDFSHNEIKTIPKNAFKYLKSLQVLALDNNEIKTLSHGMLKGLDQLMYLFLHNNQIKIISEGIFNDAPHLKQINLGNNLIEKIDPKAFEGFVKLSEINLRNNEAPNNLQKTLEEHYPLIIFRF
jgi:Leucine-rich repeat (LRR) protein